MIIVLTIPGELTDLNTYINAERTNRYIAAKLKKIDTETVRLCCLNARRTYAGNEADGQEVTGKVAVKMIWYTKNRKKDPDNIAFAKKFVLDGMVKAKILPQDSYKWIGSFQDLFKVDAENPRVEICITEFAEWD